VGRTCVFCASSTVADQHHQLARELGAAVAAAGDELVYGGTTTGLMGDVAAGARAAGGRVVGVVPSSMAQLWSVDGHLDELVEVPDLGSRKAEMVRDAHRVVVLPGGLGTLDELLEVLTFRQLGLVARDLDVVLLDPDGFWDPFLAQLDVMLEAGTVRAPNIRLRTARTAAEALAGP
jgi:uncharacterized protein (TIGR00730 family)